MNTLWTWTMLAMIGSACGTPPESQDDVQETEPSTTSSGTAYPVKTMLSEISTFSYPVQARGRLQSERVVELTFPVAGRLEYLAVRNTQLVMEGQLLARLENDRMKIGVEEAKVAVANAESEFENLLAEYGDSLGYGDSWTRIREKVALKTGLEAARVALRRASYELSQTYLYAPFAGVIEGLEIREGNYVNAFQPLATIMDPKRMEVLTEVLEFDIGDLRTGDPATVRPLATNRAIAAAVKEINPAVREDGYIQVKLGVEGTEGLYNGMSMKVSLEIPQNRGILVPKEAVVQKSGRNVIFTAEKNLAKWNYVTLGKDNGDFVEVLDGLEVGARVIVSNNLQLAHDSPILPGEVQKTDDR